MSLCLNMVLEDDSLIDEAPNEGVIGQNIASEDLEDDLEAHGCRLMKYVVYWDDWDEAQFDDPNVVLPEVIKAIEVISKLPEDSFMDAQDSLLEDMADLEEAVKWACAKSLKIKLAIS